jgi:hypothetical protein
MEGRYLYSNIMIVDGWRAGRLAGRAVEQGFLV